MFETIINLKPQKDWRPGMDTDKLIAEMDKALQFPGVANSWTMPIKTRIDMLSTGIKTPIGIKVSGPDLNVMETVAGDIESDVQEFTGHAAAFAERITGGYYLDFESTRGRGALRADRGRSAGCDPVRHRRRERHHHRGRTGALPRQPALPARTARRLEQIARECWCRRPRARRFRWAQVADVQLQRGAASINTENATAQCLHLCGHPRPRHRRLCGRGEETSRWIQSRFPPAITLVWSGQFEYMERAAASLKVVMPFTLLIIFLLLYLNFRNLVAPAVVMLSIPFALVGGFWLLWLLGYNMTVAVAVGFIALAGVAAETGVVMLTFIDQAIAKRRAETGGHLGDDDIMGAVLSGTTLRVRPIAMTATAVIAGLVPIMWGSGTGSDVMQRIAAPMIGGMVTATILSLLVLPVIYGWVLLIQERRRNTRV